MRTAGARVTASGISAEWPANVDAHLAVFAFNSSKNRNIGASATNALNPPSRCFHDPGRKAEPANSSLTAFSVTRVAIRKIVLVPITVFDVRGIPAARRERIEAAVEAAARQVAAPHEAWIVADPFRGGFKIVITGPYGLERPMAFAVDEDPGTITERTRAAPTVRARPLLLQLDASRPAERQAGSPHER